MIPGVSVFSFLGALRSRLIYIYSSPKGMFIDLRKRERHTQRKAERDRERQRYERETLIGCLLYRP